jgi:phosphoserine phosphatase RsbU/P
LVIPPGGTLFMVSDALLEIPAINNKALGWAGVSNLLRDAIINHGPKADVHSILAPFLSVVARPLRDDLTAICCQRP